MATYWLSFRLEDSGAAARTYESRYDALVEAVNDLARKGQVWFETTSFYFFTSELSITQVAAQLKAAIREDVDLIVLGMTDFKSARVIGKVRDQDIFALVPFMKKA